MPLAGTATLPRSGTDENDLDEADLDEAPAPQIPRLPFLPGLEGLRAIALLAVLTFAGGITQVRGGFLGISTAFTLAGFLLTTLALSEWGERSRLSLADLWERRALRLIPSVYFVIALVIVLQLTVRVGAVPTFRTDVWGALGFVTNWQLAFPADGFARSFQDLSALRHLWPVAIAVQLTVLVPVLFAGIMAVTSRRWHTACAVFAALAAASFATAWMVSGTPETMEIVYFGTHTRAGELLVGMVLAYIVLTPSLRGFIQKPQVMNIVRTGGIAALGALLALWLLLPIDSDVLFRGGTLANAILTAWVILALTMPGPLSSALSSWPLQKLGEISFCAYLLHWPIFLLLDSDRLPVDGAPLFLVRVTATILAGLAVAWAIEATFRWRLSIPRLQLIAGVGLTAAILAIVVLVLPVNPPANISLTVNDGSGPGELDVVAPAGGSEAARVLILGDEMASSVVPGFESWNEENPSAQLRVDTHVAADCPLGGPGSTRRFGESVEPSIDCEAWRFRLPKMLEAADYDAVVVLMGTADLGEREVHREWRHLGDPLLDRWMAEQIAALATLVETPDAPVVWLTLPHVRMVPDSDDGEAGWATFDDNDPQRADRLNVLIQGTLGRRDGFDVADLTAWLQDQRRGEFNPEIRSGSEFTEEGADLVAEWLAPQVLDVAGASPADGDADGDGSGDDTSDED